MGIKIAFVSLPKIDNGHILCEDCCGNSSGARVLPGLILSCASAARSGGLDVSFIDLSIDSADLSLYDYVVYGKPWLYHDKIDDVMSKITTEKQRVVIAIPSGYKNEYESSECKSARIVVENYEQYIAGLFGVRTSEFSETSTDYTLIPTNYWRKYKSAIYQVTRGCSYRCKFCAWGGSTVTSKRFVFRQPSVVARDINEIRELSTKRLSLSLLCSQLTSRTGWLIEFAELMKDDPYPYSSNVNLAEVTQEKLELLKMSGCISVTAGLEGLSDSVLRRIGKGFTLQTALNSISMLATSGLSFRLHYRFGFGESIDDIKEQTENLFLLRKALGNDVTKVLSVGPLIHYKGTMLFDDASYKLANHDDVEHAKIQADIQWREWINFFVEAKRLGLLRKFRRLPKMYRKEWRERCEDITN